MKSTLEDACTTCSCIVDDQESTTDFDEPDDVIQNGVVTDSTAISATSERVFLDNRVASSGEKVRKMHEY